MMMADNNTNSEKKTPVLGILSTIAGGISLIPFLGVVSPVGLILGVIGLVKETPKLMSIIGTSLSVLGVATSPILWALVACTFDSAQCETDAKETPVIEQSVEESYDSAIPTN
jgi:hypothetical protein